MELVRGRIQNPQPFDYIHIFLRHKVKLSDHGRIELEGGASLKNQWRADIVLALDTGTVIDECFRGERTYAKCRIIL